MYNNIMNIFYNYWDIHRLFFTWSNIKPVRGEKFNIIKIEKLRLIMSQNWNIGYLMAQNWKKELYI